MRGAGSASVADNAAQRSRKSRRVVCMVARRLTRDDYRGLTGEGTAIPCLYWENRGQYKDSKKRMLRRSPELLPWHIGDIYKCGRLVKSVTRETRIHFRQQRNQFGGFLVIMLIQLGANRLIAYGLCRSES